MAASTSWLRFGAGLVLVTGLLGLSSGCHKGSNNPAGTVNVDGYLFYTRTPVVYDLNGAPTTTPGTAYQAPARGILVRAFQLYNEYDQSGNLIRTWRLAGTSVTDINGEYNFSGLVYAGYPVFLEVDGVFQQVGGHNATVQINANSDGIGSLTPEPLRPIYAYRIDLSGNPYPNPGDTTPPNSPVPSTIFGDTSMNIALSAGSEAWVATLANWYQQETAAAQKPIESIPGIGSRVLSILDSIYNFSYFYGDPTPSTVPNGTLDLHYYPGRTESPNRSFVNYNPADLTAPGPNGTTIRLASDGTKLHYFGSLAGGPSADDATDPGAIYPLLARNNLFGQNRTTLTPTGSSQLLTSLAPDLAVVDGMGDAMAATLLQTPHLTDTTAATGLVGRDIRNAAANNPIPAVGAASPAVVAAVSWNLSVAANAVANGFYYPGLGTPAQWAKYLPQNMGRYVALQYPYVLAGTSANLDIRSDIVSLYGQLSRLQEPKTSADVLDLRQIFPDTTLYLQLSPFNIPWTSNTSWQAITQYTTNWGTNPGFGAAPAASTSFTLSMANATMIPNPAILTTVAPPFVPATPPLPTNVYPNSSQGEVAYAELALNVDHQYTLRVTSAAPLPAGATIEVLVDGAIVAPALPNPQPHGPFLFSADSMAPVTFTLTGNPLDYSNPIWHYLRIRLLSPTIQQPDLTVTVSLS